MMLVKHNLIEAKEQVSDRVSCGEGDIKPDYNASWGI